MPKDSEQSFFTVSYDWRYWLACILLTISIALYITSLTMNVARVTGTVEIDKKGIDEMVKMELGDNVPFDEIADEIGDLIREYVSKMKAEVPNIVSDQIDIGDVSRTINKELKKRGAQMMDSIMPSIDIDVPELGTEPKVSNIKLLTTIRDLYRGDEETPPDFFLATCILLFTIFFPVTKYIALSWILAPANKGKEQVLNWLKNWGQWSMGDVFVIAFMVTFIKINTSIISSPKIADIKVADIKVHVDVLPGMYLFAAAIIAGMIASMLVSQFVKETTTPAVDTPKSGKKETTSKRKSKK